MIVLKRMELWSTMSSRQLGSSEEQCIVVVQALSTHAIAWQSAARRKWPPCTATQSPETFDLVITDMTMPHMTGDVLARELITIRPDIPINLTDEHEQEETEEGLFRDIFIN